MTEGAITVTVREEGGTVTAAAAGSVTARLSDVYDTLDLSRSSVLRAIRTITGQNYHDFYFACLTKTLTPGAVRIVKDDRIPLVMSTRTYRNTSSFPAAYDGRLSVRDSNSISVSWSDETRADAAFQIGFEAIISGSASMTVGHTFGKRRECSHSVEVAADDGVSVTLQPGRAVLASLAVHRRDVTVELDYRVEYGGDVVGSYLHNVSRTFELREILEKCGCDTHHEATETVRLRYFTDAEVVLRDL